MNTLTDENWSKNELRTQKLGGSKRFSAIAIHNDVVYLAGQVSQVVEGDITEQSKDVFAKVDSLLAEAGTTHENVFSV